MPKTPFNKLTSQLHHLDLGQTTKQWTRQGETPLDNNLPSLNSDKVVTPLDIELLRSHFISGLPLNITIVLKLEGTVIADGDNYLLNDTNGKQSFLIEMKEQSTTYEDSTIQTLTLNRVQLTAVKNYENRNLIHCGETEVFDPDNWEMVFQTQQPNRYRIDSFKTFEPKQYLITCVNGRTRWAHKH